MSIDFLEFSKINKERPDWIAINSQRNFKLGDVFSFDGKLKVIAEFQSFERIR